jgi:hypothetical protein
VLPAAGTRFLVPVGSVVQSFFRNLSTFFSFGIPIEKRVADLSLSGSGVSSVCRPSGTGMPCGLLPTAAVEGRRRGRGYMVDPIRPGKFFRSLSIFFQSYPQVVDKSGSLTPYRGPARPAIRRRIGTDWTSRWRIEHPGGSFRTGERLKT